MIEFDPALEDVFQAMEEYHRAEDIYEVGESADSLMKALEEYLYPYQEDSEDIKKRIKEYEKVVLESIGEGE